MNPYAERFWSAIAKPPSVYVADALAEQLPPHLAARIGKREFEETIRNISSVGFEWFVTILDFRSSPERLVTVSNLVTAADKTPGPGRDEYLRHRAGLLTSGANVVEIDLVRGGSPVTLAGTSPATAVRPADYHAGLHRAARPDRIEYYPIGLRERLPSLRVPTTYGEPDVVLDLQPLVDQAYVKGRYYDQIDYSRPPEPPLDPGGAAWANAVLRDAGLA